MKRIYFFIIFLFATKALQAQNAAQKTISVNFNQANISAFVADLETKSGYTFYVDTAQFDSLKVTLQVSDVPLANVLHMAFLNTNYNYTIIPSSSEVFLTKGKAIKTRLAAGYFAKGTVQEQEIVSNPVNDVNMDKEKPAAEATTENKLYEVGVKTDN